MSSRSQTKRQYETQEKMTHQEVHKGDVVVVQRQFFLSIEMEEKPIATLTVSSSWPTLRE